MILIMPRPQMLATMMMAMETSASHQQLEALDTAEGARFRPMRMMMGPVTTGGRKCITRWTPTALMMAARITYSRPAMTMPPQAYCNFSEGSIVAYMPELNSAMAEKPPRKAKDEPKKAGTFSFVQKWKNRVPKPAKKRVVCVFRGRP